MHTKRRTELTKTSDKTENSAALIPKMSIEYCSKKEMKKLRRNEKLISALRESCRYALIALRKR
jgi:hypothetical protein